MSSTAAAAQQEEGEEEEEEEGETRSDECTPLNGRDDQKFRYFSQSVKKIKE